MMVYCSDCSHSVFTLGLLNCGIQTATYDRRISAHWIRDVDRSSAKRFAFVVVVHKNSTHIQCSLTSFVPHLVVAVSQ